MCIPVHFSASLTSSPIFFWHTSSLGKHLHFYFPITSLEFIIAFIAYPKSPIRGQLCLFSHHLAILPTSLVDILFMAAPCSRRVRGLVLLNVIHLDASSYLLTFRALPSYHPMYLTFSTTSYEHFCFRIFKIHVSNSKNFCHLT